MSNTGELNLLSEIRLALSACSEAAGDDNAVREQIDNLFIQNGDRRKDLIQHLLCELFAAVYSKKEKPVTSRREKTNISPSSSPAVDYIHRDDAEDLGTGSDDNIVTNDYSYRGSGMDISPRPVTSASQITINKHNSPANRDISLPSRKELRNRQNDSGSDIPSSSSSEGNRDSHDEDFYNSLDSDNQQEYDAMTETAWKEALKQSMMDVEEDDEDDDARDLTHYDLFKLLKRNIRRKQQRKKQMRDDSGIAAQALADSEGGVGGDGSFLGQNQNQPAQPLDEEEEDYEYPVFSAPLHAPEPPPLFGNPGAPTGANMIGKRQKKSRMKKRNSKKPPPASPKKDASSLAVSSTVAISTTTLAPDSPSHTVVLAVDQAGGLSPLVGGNSGDGSSLENAVATANEVLADIERSVHDGGCRSPGVGGTSGSKASPSITAERNSAQSNRSSASTGVGVSGGSRHSQLSHSPQEAHDRILSSISPGQASGEVEEAGHKSTIDIQIPPPGSEPDEDEEAVFLYSKNTGEDIILSDDEEEEEEDDETENQIPNYHWDLVATVVQTVLEDELSRGDEQRVSGQDDMDAVLTSRMLDRISNGIMESMGVDNVDMHVQEAIAPVLDIFRGMSISDSGNIALMTQMIAKSTVNLTRAINKTPGSDSERKELDERYADFDRSVGTEEPERVEDGDLDRTLPAHHGQRSSAFGAQPSFSEEGSPKPTAAEILQHYGLLDTVQALPSKFASKPTAADILQNYGLLDEVNALPSRFAQPSAADGDSDSISDSGSEPVKLVPLDASDLVSDCSSVSTQGNNQGHFHQFSDNGEGFSGGQDMEGDSNSSTPKHYFYDSNAPAMAADALEGYQQEQIGMENRHIVSDDEDEEDSQNSGNDSDDTGDVASAGSEERNNPDAAWNAVSSPMDKQFRMGIGEYDRRGDVDSNSESESELSEAASLNSEDRADPEAAWNQMQSPMDKKFRTGIGGVGKIPDVDHLIIGEDSEERDMLNEMYLNFGSNSTESSPRVPRSKKTLQESPMSAAMHDQIHPEALHAILSSPTATYMGYVASDSPIGFVDNKEEDCKSLPFTLSAEEQREEWNCIESRDRQTAQDSNEDNMITVDDIPSNFGFKMDHGNFSLNPEGGWRTVSHDEDECHDDCECSESEQSEASGSEMGHVSSSWDQLFAGHGTRAQEIAGRLTGRHIGGLDTAIGVAFGGSPCFEHEIISPSTSSPSDSFMGTDNSIFIKDEKGRVARIASPASSVDPAQGEPFFNSSPTAKTLSASGQGLINQLHQPGDTPEEGSAATAAYELLNRSVLQSGNSLDDALAATVEFDILNATGDEDGGAVGDDVLPSMHAYDEPDPVRSIHVSTSPPRITTNSELNMACAESLRTVAAQYSSNSEPTDTRRRSSRRKNRKRNKETTLLTLSPAKLSSSIRNRQANKAQLDSCDSSASRISAGSVSNTSCMSEQLFQEFDDSNVSSSDESESDELDDSAELLQYGPYSDEERGDNDHGEDDDDAPELKVISSTSPSYPMDEGQTALLGDMSGQTLSGSPRAQRYIIPEHDVAIHSNVGDGDSSDLDSDSDTSDVHYQPYDPDIDGDGPDGNYDIYDDQNQTDEEEDDNENCTENAIRDPDNETAGEYTIATTVSDDLVSTFSSSTTGTRGSARQYPHYQHHMDAYRNHDGSIGGSVSVGIYDLSDRGSDDDDDDSDDDEEEEEEMERAQYELLFSQSSSALRTAGATNGPSSVPGILMSPGSAGAGLTGECSPQNTSIESQKYFAFRQELEDEYYRENPRATGGVTEIPANLAGTAGGATSASKAKKLSSASKPVRLSSTFDVAREGPKRRAVADKKTTVGKKRSSGSGSTNKAGKSPSVKTRRVNGTGGNDSDNLDLNDYDDADEDRLLRDVYIKAAGKQGYDKLFGGSGPSLPPPSRSPSSTRKKAKTGKKEAGSGSRSASKKIPVRNSNSNGNGTATGTIDTDTDISISDVTLQSMELMVKSTLGSISKANRQLWSEIRSFKSPPPLVKVTMEAVCVLMGLDTEWSMSKWLLGQSHFVHLLSNIDMNNIPRKIMNRLVEDYFNHPSFNADVVDRQSRGAGMVCRWVRALVMYDNVLRKSQREMQEAELRGSHINIPTGRALQEVSESEDVEKYEVIEATEFEGFSEPESQQSDSQPLHYHHYEHAARVESGRSKTRPLSAPKISKSMDDMEVRAITTRPKTASAASGRSSSGNRKSAPASGSAQSMRRSTGGDGRVKTAPAKRPKAKTLTKSTAEPNVKTTGGAGFRAPTASSAVKKATDPHIAPPRAAPKVIKPARSVPHVLDTLLRKY